MLKWLKSKISLNLFSYLGWLSVIGYEIIDIAPHFNSTHHWEYVLLGYLIVLYYYVYSGWFVLFLIDLLLRFKLKNKFILENKFYNIFWLIGFIVASLIAISFAVMYITTLIGKH